MRSSKTNEQEVDDGIRTNDLGGIRTNDLSGIRINNLGGIRTNDLGGIRSNDLGGMRRILQSLGRSEMAAEK